MRRASVSLQEILNTITLSIARVLFISVDRWCFLKTEEGKVLATLGIHLFLFSEVKKYSLNLLINS